MPSTSRAAGSTSNLRILRGTSSYNCRLDAGHIHCHEGFVRLKCRYSVGREPSGDLRAYVRSAHNRTLQLLVLCDSVACSNVQPAKAAGWPSLPSPKIKMVLTTIFVIRHGVRLEAKSNVGIYADNGSSGQPSMSIPSRETSQLPHIPPPVELRILH